MIFRLQDTLFNQNILSAFYFIRNICLKFCAPIILITLFLFSGCRFRGERGDEKFVRLKEDAIKGSEAFRVSAFPRSGFKIQALDGVRIRKAIFTLSGYKKHILKK